MPHRLRVVPLSLSPSCVINNHLNPLSRLKTVDCRLQTADHRLQWSIVLQGKLILHMPWNPDDVIGCIFIFRIHLSSMENLCVLKKITWKLPLLMASVSRLACAPSPTSHKQSLRKPLPLRKISCVSTANADTPPTIMYQASILMWLASSIISVHFYFGTVKNLLPLPQSFLISDHVICDNWYMYKLIFCLA